MNYSICIKSILLFFVIGISIYGNSQELYVYTEPASTMPAKSVIVKQSYLNMEGISGANWNTQIEMSPKKNWMAHVGTNFSAADFYLQHRFFSTDEVHKHTRLAWYGKAVSAGGNPSSEAILLDGQHKLWGAGLIATRLQHKWASSITVGYLNRYTGNTQFSKNALQYSFSNGLLIFPRTYRNYQQTNFNVYVEMLGQKLLDKKGHYLDIAPAIQFIFHSQAKLNLGYRWPIIDDLGRPSNKSYYISFDYLFFNALSKAKR